MAKAHKTMTEDVNFIQYDELKDLYECVDDLAKMTRRLQIVGTSAFSILRDDRKLNTGVCIQGHVSQPDNLFVPMANFFDEKIVPIETIAEYLTTGSRQTVIPMDIKNHRYALTGSIIFSLLKIPLQISISSIQQWLEQLLRRNLLHILYLRVVYALKTLFFTVTKISCRRQY